MTYRSANLEVSWNISLTIWQAIENTAQKAFSSVNHLLTNRPAWLPGVGMDRTRPGTGATRRPAGEIATRLPKSGSLISWVQALARFEDRGRFEGAANFEVPFWGRGKGTL